MATEEHCGANGTLWREVPVEQSLSEAPGLPSQEPADLTQRILSQDCTQDTTLEGSQSSAPSNVEAWGKLVSTSNPATPYLFCGDAAGRRFSIGRKDSCDVIVSDPGVSLIHCYIYRAAVNGVQRSLIIDRSTNGTFLNGKRLVRDKEYELFNGDEIILCQRRKRLFSALESGTDHVEHKFIFRDLLHVRRQQRARSIQSTPHGQEVIYFQKGQEIGRGGCGTVFLGMNVANGTLLAIKQVQLKMESDVAALEREVQLLRELRHPCIVQYLGTARSAANLTVLLEFVPGGSMASLLSKFGPFHEPVMRVYLQQILQGLEYLHHCDVVHGDIKPANILVSVTGGIKVSDFGASFKASRLTGADLPFLGTAHYMAPEAIRDRGCTPAADVWAVGCTVIEMASARPPWSERRFDNAFAAFFHIAQAEQPPVIPPVLSPAASALTADCLRLAAAQRPSCTALLQYPFITTAAPPVRRPDDPAVVEIPAQRPHVPQASGDCSLSELALHSDFLRQRSFGLRTDVDETADEATDPMVLTPTSSSLPHEESSTGVTSLVENIGLQSRDSTISGTA